MAAASGHIVRGKSERAAAAHQWPRQIQNQANIKEVQVRVLGFFMFLSAVSAGWFCLVLDPSGRLRGLGGKVGSETPAVD